jgi:hypothetical protein
MAMVARTRALVVAASAASGLAVTFAAAASRRIGRWGATCEEVNKPLPGDDEVPDPAVASTRVISIWAPAGAIWPWLVQMGWRRAGWYSYDLIDNDHIHSAERILPEFQGLQTGDFVPEGEEAGWTVRALEKDRLLLLVTHAPMVGVDWVQRRDSSWLFLLDEVGPEHTRLVERVRTTLTMNTQTLAGRILAARLARTLLLAPGDFVMARRQMLGIKRRAEREWRNVPHKAASPTRPGTSPQAP